MKQPDTALIISLRAKEINGRTILGTGGWISPEEREEIDWMIFIRFMGWRSKLIDPSFFTKQILETENIKWIIFCGNPDEADGRFWSVLLNSIKENPLLFISKAGSKDGDFASACKSYTNSDSFSGTLLRWRGMKVKKGISCRAQIEIPFLNIEKGAEIFARLSQKAIVSVTKYGKSKLAAMSFSPGTARDLSGYFTLLIKELFIMESVLPLAWYNWENTLILRMDDPGSQEVVYNDLYNTSKLRNEDWTTIGKELKRRNARMSLGYVSGWVDDGNEERGDLSVKGRRFKRESGKLHASPDIRYEKKIKNNEELIYDFRDEFKGIQNLRKQRLAEIEVHGFTHLHPDRMLWANSADRYTNVSWFREFGREKINYLEQHPDHEHPLFSGINAIRKYFNTNCSTLICPGDEFTNDVLTKLLQTKLLMVSSYYLALRIGNQICWAQHVCAPYLDTAEAKWFDSPLPVVGYFHDFDISINGTAWFSKNLKAWENAGAKNMIDFREAAGRLSHLLSADLHGNQLEIRTTRIADFRYVKPVTIGIHVPENNFVTHIELSSVESERN